MFYALITIMGISLGLGLTRLEDKKMNMRKSWDCKDLTTFPYGIIGSSEYRANKYPQGHIFLVIED